jgi:hypothetical protein
MGRLNPPEFSGYSLCAASVASAAEASASIFGMIDVSRHELVDVLCGYVQWADLFKEHAGAAFL